MADAERSVQKQFAKNPEKYRDERLFSSGTDLKQMIDALPLTGREKVLDIGSGAGHTALAFAPFVKQCIGLDLTEDMVRVATDLARDRRAENVSFRQGNAEQLPFQDASFDIVTCRFAAHHFADVRQVMREVKRVLKTKGIFLLVDHYAPEDEVLDAFINELDRMRDPSHVREYSLSEWERLFAENGFTYEKIYQWDLPIHFSRWIERAGTPPDMEKKIISFLQTATPLCKDTFKIELDASGDPLSFCLKAVLLQGMKQEKTQ